MERKNTDYSIALSYILGTNVPIIVASGKGDIAKRIRKIAQENDVEIVENSDLANILIQEEIGACIPEETYMAIASIFAFLIKKKESNNVKKN